jgi:putative ABC transport system permease protein
VLEAIARINRELGTTAVVITHNAAIAAMADRVIVLGDGRIQREETQRAQDRPGRPGGVVMKALNRKLLRDLRLMWSQALTIALVVASGVGGFITTLSAVDSLALARERFYAQGHFADLFAGRQARAAGAGGHAARPARRGRRADRVWSHRAHHAARQERPHHRPAHRHRPAAPAAAEPADAAQRRGRRRRGLARACAVRRRAAGLGVGIVCRRPPAAPRRALHALVNGRQRTLVVAGIALSPEFIFAGLWGMPDQRGFGVFWVDHEALAAAYDMQGAFNQAALKLAPGADERAVAAAVQALLEPYGAREVHGRRTRPRTPCSTTRSRSSTSWAPCCPASSWAWRPSC